MDFEEVDQDEPGETSRNVIQEKSSNTQVPEEALCKLDKVVDVNMSAVINLSLINNDEHQNEFGERILVRQTTDKVYDPGSKASELVHEMKVSKDVEGRQEGWWRC